MNNALSSAVRLHLCRSHSPWLSRALQASFLLCSLLGPASASGNAPPSPAEVLALLKSTDVCIGEGATVSSSVDIPNTFLMSYSEMTYDVTQRHREVLYFGGGQHGKCKVYTHIALAFDGREPRFSYTLRMQLIRDPWSSTNPGVVWESGAVGIADSMGTLENLQSVVDELYVRLLADWRRTHP